MQLRANRGTEMESEGENSYAADQEKHYPDSVLHYTGDILLVAINYDKNSKSIRV